MTHGPWSIRPTRLAEAELLPDVERSAAQAFLTIPELGWIAEDDVMSVEQHRRFAEAGASWVAVAPREPVGFVCVEPFGPDLHVWELAVRHAEQGRGMGTALMHTVQVQAMALQLRRVTLTTFRNVPWNEAFYRQLGFRVIESPHPETRLSRTLDREVEHGLLLERRCAMELTLGPR